MIEQFPTDAPGVLGPFDKVNDYCDIRTAATGGTFPTDVANQLLGDITVEAKITVASSDSLKCISSNEQGFGAQGTAGGFTFVVNNTNTVAFAAWTGSYAAAVTSVATIPVNTSVHVAGVRSNSAKTLAVLIDAVLSKILDIAALPDPIIGANQICVGRDLPNGRWFHGTIDYIRYWKSARTPEQLAANKDRQIYAPEPGLVESFNFDWKDTSGRVYSSIGTGRFMLLQNGLSITQP